MEEVLVELFNNSILLKVSRSNQLLSNIIIVTINIKLVVLKFPLIIDFKASNSNVIILIFSLKALKSEKDFAFLINNLDFRALILIIQKDNKVFIAIATTRSNRIIDITINQVQRTLFKANIRFIRRSLRLFNYV